jgi:hypothetical protein
VVIVVITVIVVVVEVGWWVEAGVALVVYPADEPQELRAGQPVVAPQGAEGGE